MQRWGPMMDEKPSTKHLILKPKEIVPTDKLARPGDGTAISVQLIHQQNLNAEAKAAARKKSNMPFPQPAEPEPSLPAQFKPKQIEVLNAPANPADEEAIRVKAILLENSWADQRSGWAPYRFWKKKSRRTRDFLLGIGATDAVIAVVTYKMQDTVSLIFGIAAITVITSSAAWIMFVVMDDY